VSAWKTVTFAKPGCRLVFIASLLTSSTWLWATPANKIALEQHFDRFLAKGLARCTTCHLPTDNPAPKSLDDFPHNPFGHRLRILGLELVRSGAKKNIPTRLQLIAREDADGDGVDNQTELLLGRNPGDAKDRPSKAELRQAGQRRTEFARFLASYRWLPFEPVERPALPLVKDLRWAGNPIDVFIAAEHRARKLTPRPEASKEVLLRRVFLDLIGLSPTPEEQRAFATDTSGEAYEKVVDRLLDDPRYGERWGRHWMDIWRYSDWAGWSGGNQIRDSKPHIWRWRDWIVESLNEDKGYARMLQEMLAADELAPEDPNALRATGYLARNFKMLSREQWLDDTIKHTSQAFLGLTLGCARCHDHMTDPILQSEYYQLRAIFEPHQVRTDRLPGQFDTTKDGLVRVFDTDTNAPTYFYTRGDERRPDTNRVISPGVPAVLGGKLRLEPVKLPRCAALPDKRQFVIHDAVATSEKAVADAQDALAKLRNDAAAKLEKLVEQELNAAIAGARHASLLATLRAERLEDESKKQSEEWTTAATEAAGIQRQLAVLEAKLKRHSAQVAEAEARRRMDEAARSAEAASAPSGKSSETAEATADKVAVRKKEAEKAAEALEAAKKRTTEAEKALTDVVKELESAPTTAYKPRPMETYPAASTGRRLAFSRWLANRENPLTARVAMNHLWLRHFGRGIVPTPADFGRNGRAPSHPQLLDWLASEFMARNWSMKEMHRLMVTSRTYRMASTPDDANARIDPDNVYLWRMNSRRMEAELVRDNLLYVSGELDPAMGGPDIDHLLGLSSKRRSLYLRIAAEKEVEFLKIFDGPSVTECYLRRPTVVPQQALALANSELTLRQARRWAEGISGLIGEDDRQFITEAFQRIIARSPTPSEIETCQDSLARQTVRMSKRRACENLVLVLFNHNDFVTIR
jgi:hypothetical protein